MIFGHMGLLSILVRSPTQYSTEDMTVSVLMDWLMINILIGLEAKRNNTVVYIRQYLNWSNLNHHRSVSTKERACRSNQLTVDKVNWPTESFDQRTFLQRSRG